VHPDWKEGKTSEARPDIVTVKLKDGRVYRQEVDKPRGSPGLPLSHNELLAKYRDCAGLFLSARDVERSIELVENLEKLDNVNELMSIVTGG
ncbi:MAG: hypothetical protein Q8O76_07385, partial [Chloroflexota bacterium]|nr:hypothetical protein [Chloroflexota bacterium]